MLVNESGNTTDCNAEQYWNALESMFVKVFGNTTDVNAEHILNAL